MKKHFSLLVFVLAASSLQAQNNDTYSLMYHDLAGHRYNVEGLMQQHDGDFVICTSFFETTENYQSIFLGFVLYKISPTTHTITDSLFIAETPLSEYSYSNYFIAPNPRGEGNIMANLVYHEDCDSTFLRICHFPDNNLQVDHNEDLVVPMCGGTAELYYGLVDYRGDLIIKYAKEFPDFSIEDYIARIGLDGTLKLQTLLFVNFESGSPRNNLNVLKESPLKYFQWGKAGNYPVENLAIYEIDTLFHKNTKIINCILSEDAFNSYYTAREYLYLDLDAEVIPAEGDDILVAAQYRNDTNYNVDNGEHGVAMVKYDLRTMHPKGHIVFNDYPGYTGGQCMGLKKMADGTVYFMYKEQGYPAQSINVVKMDTDLNVEWKRFCKTDDVIMPAPLWYPAMYKDEHGEEKGIAWCGYAKKSGMAFHAIVYFLLNHDGTVGMSEGGIEVRPYAFYPNPVKEQLLMEFSPDVQPTQVELYDLQGRLVRTQDKTFESINMGQLPSGTYTMRVTMVDGKAYMDKVVKE